MNTNQILYAIALSETLSFSRAAKECNVTQPTLSNGISHLEKEMGNTLFIRNTRQVSITHFGEDILPSMKEMLKIYRNIIAQVEEGN